MYALILLISLVGSITALPPTTLLKEMFSSKPTMGGKLTYYGATTGGNCGYTNKILSIPWAARLVPIAMNEVQYIGNDKSQGCGVCIKYIGDGTGSGRPDYKPSTTTPKIAIVTDLCPRGACNKGSIDIGASGDGVWGVKWSAIPCPSDTFMYYQFQGANDNYMKMQVIGHKLPVIAMTFTSASGVSKDGERTTDNFFIANLPNPFTFPMSVTVTASNGDTVKITGVTLQQVKTTGVLYKSNVQFSGTTFAEGEAAAEGDTVVKMTGRLAVVLGVLCALIVVVVVAIVVLLIRKRQRVETV